MLHSLINLTMLAVLLLLVALLHVSVAFVPPTFGRRVAAASTLKMADVEITFPNNKKVKVASGSPMKEGERRRVAFALAFFNWLLVMGRPVVRRSEPVPWAFPATAFM